MIGLDDQTTGLHGPNLTSNWMIGRTDRQTEWWREANQCTSLLCGERRDNLDSIWQLNVRCLLLRIIANFLSSTGYLNFIRTRKVAFYC